MTEHHGTLSLDVFNGRVELSLRSPAAKELIEFSLPPGFGLADVHEALTATGLVETIGDEQLLLAPVSCRQLRDWLVEMFAGFRRPGEFDARLVQVMAAVEDHPLCAELRPQIPVWAYAWLDIQVRDEIADDARTSDEVWNENELALEIARLRDRRIRDLLRRYAMPALSAGLAPSTRSRPGSAGRSQTG